MRVYVIGYRSSVKEVSTTYLHNFYIYKIKHL